MAFVVDAHAPHGQKSVSQPKKLYQMKSDNEFVTFSQVMSYINLHEFEPNERDAEGELLDIRQVTKNPI